MNLYKCVIEYRVGTYNSNFRSKTLYIEADCGLTAYAYCKAISAGWNNVYKPVVTRMVQPKPDITLTLNKVKNEYGAAIARKALEESEFEDFRHDDRDLGVIYEVD